MKRSLFLTSILVLSLGLMAQIKTAETLVRIETPKFNPEYENPKCVYVPMDFNESDALSKLGSIDISKISSITLVYSQYKSSERFDQLALNDERTYQLYKMMPSIADAKDIQWYWVAQTDCHSPEECKGYFHGFEIRLEAEEVMLKAKEAEDKLELYLKLYSDKELSTSYLDSVAAVKGSTIVKECHTEIKIANSTKNRLGNFKRLYDNSDKKLMRAMNKHMEIEGNYFYVLVDDNRKVTKYGELNSKEEKKMERLFKKYYYITSSRIDGTKLYTEFAFNLHRNSRGKIVDFEIQSIPMNENGEIQVFQDRSIEYVEEEHCRYIDTSAPTTAVDLGYNNIYDTVIFSVFNRNTHWNNCLIATDVTGSMSPYLAQFLLWHKMNMNSRQNNQDYVFFNDGDNKPDIAKVTGHVGGTYFVQTKQFKDLDIMLRKAQIKGNGGDGPENNIEAVLYGLKKNPKVNGVIMVADNYATPRDLSLIKKVEKPIHVIVCGARTGVNLAYLNLALETGGTLHTIEADIEDLAKMNEGESIAIGGMEYHIKNGKFEQKISTP